MVKCDDSAQKAAFTHEDNQCSQDTGGFSFYLISELATAEQLPKVCASAACQSVIAAVKKAQPTDCVTSWGFLLYQDVLAPIEAQCSGTPLTAAPTTAPSTTTAAPTTTTTTTPSTTTLTPSTTVLTTTPPTTVSNATAASSLTTAPPAGNTDTANSSTAGGRSSSNVIAIVAIVGGVIVVVAIIGFLVFRSRQKNKRYEGDTYQGRSRRPERVVKRHEDEFAIMGTPSRGAQSKGSAGNVSYKGSIASSVPTQASSQASSRATTSSSGQGQMPVDLWRDPDINDARIEDLQVATPARLLGRGGFCEVVVGRFEGREVAVKRLLPDLRDDPDSQHMLLAEAKTTLRLSHRHIVKLNGVAWNKPSDLCLVSELIKGRDMGKYIAYLKHDHAREGFNTEKIMMSLQVADALAYLHGHRPPVLHRDLKPANVLLTDDNTVKLADFGVSRENNATLKTAQIGTKLWMAPEQALTKNYNEKVDIFAFGVLLSELDTHQEPYSQSLQGRKLADALFFDSVRDGSLAVTFSGDPSNDPMTQIGRECVRVLPHERPSATELSRRLLEILQASQQRDKERRVVETVNY